MSSCCARQSDYRRFFRTRVAQRDARRYRRRGLDKPSRRLVDAVVARGVAGASVMEGGGGIGAIEVELLEAGADTAANIELSDAYEHEAAALLAEHRLAERVERRIGDFVADADKLPPTDVVVLHRVVCCYPDGRRLVDVAASKSTRLLALTFPRETPLTRLGVRAVNAFLGLRGCGFRTFVHSTSELLDAAAARGLRPVVRERVGPIWQLVLLERA